MNYDILIIGSGPAGMTAGIYAGRAALKTAIFEKQPGGQMGNTWSIENYPGTGLTITGPRLNDNMREQCIENGVDFVQEAVLDIKKKDDGTFDVITELDNTYNCGAVILATGADPRKLGVPGEEEYRGLGVSYCATCDANFFKNLKVICVGGGDTALEEAIYLTKFATEVYLVHRRDEFRGSKILRNRVLDNKKIKVIYDSVLEEITAGPDGLVNGALVKNVKTNEITKVDAEGVFIFVGHIPNTKMIADTDLFDLDKSGYVLVNKDMNAGTPGVYAAGDVIQKDIRQIITACADGCIAAINAATFLEEKN